MQVLATFRLGYVAQADFLQNLLGQVQRHVRPRVSHFARGTCGGRLFVALLLQPDLLENADKQFVDVVLDAR